jgi:hypothetical protein
MGASGEENTVAGAQDIAHPRKDGAERVGGHHLTQHEIVPMETMVLDGRNGQDFRRSVIIPVKSDRVLPMRDENHIVLCRRRSKLGG